MPKFSDGCFTFFKTKKDFLPLSPERIQEIAERRHIPLSVVPQYAGHRAVCSRAISATQAQITKDGWLLRKIVTEKARVVYGIVAEEKNTEEQTLAHSHEAS